MGLATVSLLAGKPRMAVVEELRERQGKEPREKHECPLCHQVHVIKEGG
jgi:hypothetical protein